MKTSLSLLVPLLTWVFAGLNFNTLAQTGLKINRDSILSIVKSDTCCKLAEYQSKILLLELAQTMSPENQAYQLKKLDSIQYYKGKFLPYKNKSSQEIQQEYEQFVNKIKTTTDTWKQLEMVLSFVYEHVNEGDYNEGLSFSFTSAKDKLLAFQRDKTSANCGGFADFTTTLLQELGFESGILSFSFYDDKGEVNPVHSAPIILLNNQIYLLEPQLARYYSTTSKPSKPIDFITLYKLAQHSQLNKIGITTIPHRLCNSLNRDVLKNETCTQDTTAKRFLVAPGVVKEQSPDMDVSFSNPMNFSLPLELHLKKKGLAKNFLSVYTLATSLQGKMEFIDHVNALLEQGQIPTVSVNPVD
ncbi:MAG: hypothetical protein K1X82_01585 [Bacteroidia bacterium]|nr:hypothetical protein [Bacteroidia bacterium]